MELDQAVKEALDKLSNDFFLLAPTVGQWTKHPTDDASIVDLETKDLLLCACERKHDSEFIIYMYNNFEGFKRLISAFRQYMTDATLKIENIHAHMQSERREHEVINRQFEDLKLKYTRLKGCLASITSDDMLLQSEGHKLAQEILNEETTAGT